MATTVTLLARKGGVGRTTLTVCLAGELAAAGASVLCVDLDGQASLSRVFLGSPAVEQLGLENSVAGVIAGFGVEAEDVVQPTAFDGIHVLPACDTLEQLAVPGVGDSGESLRHFIEDVAEQVDVVLIDTPPNTNVATTWAGLVASDHVISPIPADSFGTQSIISVQHIVSEVTRVNPGIRITGYVLNQVQRSSVTEAYVQTVRQLHGQQVFTTEVPLAVVFREAMACRQPLRQYKPRCKPAKIIGELVAELNQRILSGERKAAA